MLSYKPLIASFFELMPKSSVIPNYVSENVPGCSNFKPGHNFVKHSFRGPSCHIQKITLSDSLAQSDSGHTLII